MKKDFTHLLLGKDLRSISRSNEVVRFVEDQETFDDLFNLLLHHERLLVMRAADAVEKVTRLHPQFLSRHKDQLLSLLGSAMHKELKWHLAPLLARIDLDESSLKEVWDKLRYWTLNPNESRIVRVNSLQALFELSRKHSFLTGPFLTIAETLGKDPTPSLQARIRKLKKALKQG